jgi:hypothetical protein
VAGDAVHVLAQAHVLLEQFVLPGQFPVLEGQFGMGLGQPVLDLLELGDVHGDGILDHPAVGPAHALFLELVPAVVLVVEMLEDVGLAVGQAVPVHKRADLAEQAGLGRVVDGLVALAPGQVAEPVAEMAVDEDHIQRGHVHHVDAEGNDVEMRLQEGAFEHVPAHGRYFPATASRCSPASPS